MKKLVRGVQNVLPANTVQRLQQVYHKGRLQVLKFRQGNPAPNAKIIAITGVSGKTTTAQLIMGLLVEAGHKVAVYEPALHGESSNALNKGLQAAHTQGAAFIIIEVTPGLIKSAALDILELNMVIAVNACPEATLLLKRAVDYAVVPDGYEANDLVIAEHQIASFGDNQEADVKIGAVKLFRKGTEVTLVLDQHTSITIATFLVGYANVPNIAAAVAAAYVLGVPLDALAEGVARLEQLPGNFQYVTSSGQFTTVIDSAKNEQSAELIVASGKELAKRRLIVALAIESPKAGFLNHIQHQVDRLVVVGEDLPGAVEAANTAEEAQAIAERAAKKDDLVVLIGKPFIIKDL